MANILFFGILYGLAVVVGGGWEFLPFAYFAIACGILHENKGWGWGKFVLHKIVFGVVYGPALTHGGEWHFLPFVHFGLITANLTEEEV